MCESQVQITVRESETLRLRDCTTFQTPSPRFEATGDLVHRSPCFLIWSTLSVVPESLSGYVIGMYARPAMAISTRLKCAMACALIFLALTCAAADQPIRALAVGLFKDKAVLDINGARRVLKAGARSPEGVLLVKSTSESATIEIDGERIDLRLDGKIVGHYARGIAAKSLQLYPDPAGHYQVDGMINGNNIRFLIDTGATSVSINQATAKRIGLLYRVDGNPTRVETAAGIVAAYRVQFDEVKIRSITVKRVDGLVLDGEFPRMALLGQSFLNRLDMQRNGDMLELRER